MNERSRRREREEERETEETRQVQRKNETESAVGKVGAYVHGSVSQVSNRLYDIAQVCTNNNNNILVIACHPQSLFSSSHPLRFFPAAPLVVVASSRCTPALAPAPARIGGGGTGRRRRSEAAHIGLRRRHEPRGPFSKRGRRPVRIADGDSSRPGPHCVSPVTAAAAATAAAGAHPGRFAASLRISGFGGGGVGSGGGRVSVVVGWSVVPLVRPGTVPSSCLSLRVVAHDSGLVCDTSVHGDARKAQRNNGNE